MKKPILAALIAATALVPVAANAQEWQGRRGNRGGEQTRDDGARAERPQQQQQQQQQRTWNGDGQPRERQAFREQRRAEPVPQPQAVQPAQDRAAGGYRDRSQGWNGGRVERRDDRQDFRQERREDRRDLAGGTVTRQQFRTDRRDDRQDYRTDRRDDRQDVRRDQNRNGWNGNLGWNGNSGWNRGADRSRSAWNRSWRNDRRYDWQGWRSTNRNAYRLPRYYAPRGYNYGYQRFSIGVTLGSILFAQNYWISDPWAYRLPEADYPYRWVRYYNDALLVDTYSGEVVDVIHDIFW